MGRKFRREAFINREEETGQVLSLIDSGSGLVLYAPRRFGKTWFAKNLQAILTQEKTPSLWLDLFSIVTVKGLVKRINEEIANAFELEITTYVKKFLASFATSFSFNIGGAGLEFHPKNQEEMWEVLYETLLNVERNAMKKVVIFIDEVQELAKLDSKSENIIRTAMQHQEKTRYVFLGSRRSVINDLFFERGHPLFNSSRRFNLSKLLPTNQTEKYIKSAFIKSGKDISPQALVRVIESSKLHPFYVQLICSELWNRCKEDISPQLVNETVHALVAENSYFYQTILDNLNSQYARTVLKMLLAGELNYSAENLLKWEISSPASLSKTIKKLEDREVIVKLENEYMIFDPLFETFLKNLH